MYIILGTIIGVLIVWNIVCISFLKAKDKELDRKVQIDNNTIEENKKLKQHKDKLTDEVRKLDLSNSILKEQYEVKLDEINAIQNKLTDLRINQEKQSKEAFENYCKLLEKTYQEKEKEYDAALGALQEGYENTARIYGEDIKNNKEIMDKIREQRAAAQRALLKEKEVEDNISFYTLELRPSEIGDILQLKEVEKKLNNPRILSMLIWQTYYQKPLKTLWTKILETSSIVCGIYKITNLNTKQCYIGQSLDVLKRWTQHAKCGLGIDTPAGNKLYQSMLQEGLYNFSWELLEKCDRQQLNEREKYYIEMYDAYNLGFNSTGGNK